METVRCALENIGAGKGGFTNHDAVCAIEAFLTEASQSCPELLLRYALSEEERAWLRRLVKGPCIHDEPISIRRKLDHGERADG